MLFSTRLIIAVILGSMTLVSAARAMDGLMISNLELRATAPSAGATAGYVTIHNHGEADDRLIGAEQYRKANHEGNIIRKRWKDAHQ